MNKIYNINLGGYPIVIDDNAYAHLTKYLDTIGHHFAESEGCEEIVYDIEVRMAEILVENKKGAIIGIKEVEEVIKIMGRPEDFGAEPIEEDDYMEETTASTSGKRKRRPIKTGKRLFRDPDEKVIGGVCSGIAAYFGIADPLWIRLIFIALAFGGGVGLPAYILLWAIVPEAATTSDKLSMRGEPATVSNIAKTVEEEILELRDKINDLSKDMGSKKKALEAPLFRQKVGLRKGFLLQED